MIASRPRRTLYALGLLTTNLVRRMLREGLVLRSLTFPLAITAGALLGTPAVVAVGGTPPVIVTSDPALVPALTRALSGREITVLVDADPAAFVASGRARAGTDGHRVWTMGLRAETLMIESADRETLNAPWKFDPVTRLPDGSVGARLGTMIGRLLSGVFAMYGVVIGAGTVARDRDDGTLAAELSLPIPHWVHGASRWIAGSLVLAAFSATGVVLFTALIGNTDPAALARSAAAADATATALGLWAVGRAGLRGGFAGPLAAGLTGATAIFGVGYRWPAIGAWIPIASLATDGDGWAPLGASLLVGLAAIVSFARANRA